MFSKWHRLVSPALSAGAVGISATASTIYSRDRREGHQHLQCLDAVPRPEYVDISEEVQITKVRLAKVLNLRDLGFASRGIPNLKKDGTKRKGLIQEHDCVIADIVMKGGGANSVAESRAFERAGPRGELHFEPGEVRAAIVNCGGLCPGLNNIIHHLVNTLERDYGVTTIYGIRGGYRGLSSAAEMPDIAAWRRTDTAMSGEFEPIMLSCDVVHHWQHEGGTRLGSARGGLDVDKVIKLLEQKKINQLYIIGGDGTHRGAHKIMELCLQKGLNVAVAGVPKTIDNDIGIIDQSFGFLSAVEAAQDALRAGKVEAMGNMPNGIVVIKLMGRSAGKIAAHATLCNGDVDACLVPEVPIVLEGPNGILPHIEGVVAKKGHAVIAVAEGAGEELLGQSAQVDAGGNRVLPPIGNFIVTKITEHFKDAGKEATVKYISPSYMIRSVPANAEDAYQCYLYAANAVHGAMAGYTGFSSGMVNKHSVLIPIPILVEASPSPMNPCGRTWDRVCAVTGQPSE